MRATRFQGPLLRYKSGLAPRFILWLQHYNRDRLWLLFLCSPRYLLPVDLLGRGRLWRKGCCCRLLSRPTCRCCDYSESGQSMSCKGNCWDNSPMESWFASLKKEEVHLPKYATRAAAKTAIFDYVEVFYAPKEVPLGDSPVRRHSKINNQSPTEFEKQWQVQQLKKSA